MPGKDAKKSVSLPKTSGSSSILFLKKGTYEKIRESANFMSSGGAAKNAKTKLASRVIGIYKGEDLDSFTAVSLKDCVVDPEDGDNAAEYKHTHLFNLEKVTSSSSSDQIVGVLQTPATDGEPVTIVVSGITTAKVNVSSEDHKYVSTSSDGSGFSSSSKATAIRLVDAQSTGADTLCKIYLGAPSSAESITFINKSTQTIPPYGVAFACEVDENEDGNDWLVEVKAWNEIKDGSKKWALPFPIINGANPVEPDEISTVSNRDGFWIVEVDTWGGSVGATMGPYEGSDASKKFVVTNRDADNDFLDNDKRIFIAVDLVDPELFGGDTSKRYVLVKIRDLNAQPRNTWATGTVQSLGDFPGGIGSDGYFSGNGPPGSGFAGVYPASITVSRRYVWGDNAGTANTFTAYYFGSFPIAVGAEVICLHTGFQGMTAEDRDGWWVIDAQRWELPSDPGG